LAVVATLVATDAGALTALTALTVGRTAVFRTRGGVASAVVGL